MIVVHTNIGQHIQIEGPHEGVVMKAIEADILIPVAIGPMASGWPLLCASVRRITSSLSSITLAVPFEDDRKRFIHVRPQCFPWPGAQNSKVSGGVWFPYGMMELKFTAELVVSLAANPAGIRGIGGIGEAIWVSAIQEEDGKIAAWMHPGYLGDPFDIPTILNSVPFLSVTWSPDGPPRVQLRPDLFPEGRGAGVLAAALKDGSGFVIGYAGKDEWLSEVLRINREPQERIRGQHEPRRKPRS